MTRGSLQRLSLPLVGAVVVLVVGVGAAMWSVRGMQRTKTLRTPPLPELASTYVWSDAPVSVKEHGAEEVARQIKDSLAQRAEAVGLSNGESLLGDAHDIVLAWFGGTGRDYLAYLEKRGLQAPPVPRWSDPDESDIAWKKATEYFGDVTIDPAGIKIVERYTDGREVTPRVARSASHGWRYDKLSTLKNNATDEGIAVRANLTVREIEVPIRMDTYSGKQFDGHLGLSYAWDKGTRSWVLVRVAIYDYPNGEAVIIPPF